MFMCFKRPIIDKKLFDFLYCHTSKILPSTTFCQLQGKLNFVFVQTLSEKIFLRKKFLTENYLLKLYFLILNIDPENPLESF